MSFPKTLGACIDQLYTLQKKREAIQKEVDKIKVVESALSGHLLETFKKTDLDGARGKLGKAGLNPTTVPAVKDWEKLYRYIKKNDAWELLQKRVSSTAYRERLEAKEVIPGVEPFIVNKLSIRKR